MRIGVIIFDSSTPTEYIASYLIADFSPREGKEGKKNNVYIFENDWESRMMLGYRKKNTITAKHVSRTFESATLTFIVVFSMSINTLFLFTTHSLDKRPTGKVGKRRPTCKLECVEICFIQED